MTIPAEWALSVGGMYMLLPWATGTPAQPGTRIIGWSALKRIRSALIFPAAGESTSGNERSRRENMKAQARFPIAYYYALMIELYGPIPFKPGVERERGCAGF